MVVSSQKSNIFSMIRKTNRSTGETYPGGGKTIHEVIPNGRATAAGRTKSGSFGGMTGGPVWPGVYALELPNWLVILAALSWSIQPQSITRLRPVTVTVIGHGTP